MIRRFACALGTLALAWVSSPALGDTPIMQRPSGKEVALAAPSMVAPDEVAAAEPAPAPKAAATPAPTYTALSPHAGLSCYDPCMQPCTPAHHCKILAGGGIYYIKPIWESNPAFGVYASSDLTTSVAARSQEDFQYDYEFAPYAWAGVDLGGYGFRARAFNYDQQANDVTVSENDAATTIITATPLGLGIFTQGAGGIDPGETLFITSELRLTVIDLEAVLSTELCNWQLGISGGVRWADLSQNYNALLDDNADDLQTVALRSGHSFRGYGPVVGIEARRCLCCGLSFFGSGRFAVLVGDRTRNAFLLTADGDNLADTDFFARLNDDQDTLPVSELEVGFEWAAESKNCRFFVQAALVGHTWYGAGNAANNTGILQSTIEGDNDSFLFNQKNIDENTNLTFFGGKLAIGINY